MELTGNIKTTIVCDDAKEHVYEIIRELDTEGEEIILLTLYPTLTTPNELDLNLHNTSLALVPKHTA